jgi:tetratricopeptide (TPR) repeat protein
VGENRTIAVPPVSPRFARRAEEALAAGQIREAVQLCSEGLEQFPWYATGMYILGRCYEELGRMGEAILEFRRARSILPGTRAVREALERVGRQEQREFELFAVQHVQALQRQQGPLTFEQYIGGMAGEGESTVDFLQQQVQSAKSEEKEAEEEPAEGSPRIVTVTLAEIYAAQKEYREAIEAYRVLIEHRPLEAKRFEKRIAELEVLAAAEKPPE